MSPGDGQAGTRAGAYKKGREEFNHDEPKVRGHKPNKLAYISEPGIVLCRS
jgi:hypothetical protein